ncbi:MAG: PAS domain S-box protein [Rhodocyclaceae bacterium]|nr:PAS domain S-box protein [Rhodocyclaceae bacterium]
MKSSILAVGRNWLFVTGMYAVLGGVGLALALPPGYASPVFPASGFALAALLRFGLGAAPAVWLGALLVNTGPALLHGQLGTTSVIVGATIGGGAALQAIAGWALLRRAWRGGESALESERDVIRFLLIGGPFACLISATCGVAALLANGIITAPEFNYSWWNWYIGDTLGVLLFAPLTIALFGRHERAWVDRVKVLAVVMPAALAVAAAAFYASSRWESRQQQSELAAHGHSLEELLEFTVIGQREVIASLARFVEVAGELGTEQFRHFTAGILEEHPEISALSFNPVVRNSQRAAFEAEMSRAGEAFRISERGPDGRLVAAGQRAEYVAVAHIAPLEGNRRALGFDINSDPLRRDAVTRARATRGATATAPVALVQAHRTRSGLLLLMPAFRRETADTDGNGLLGFAVAVIKVDEMVARALAEDVSPDIVLRLSDPDAAAGRQLLFESAPPSEIAHDSEGLHWRDELAMMDRRWLLEVMPTPGYLAEHRPWIAWGVGVVGLLLATLVQMLILGILGRTATIRRRVDEQTLELSGKSRALEESEARFRSVVTSVKEVILQVDADGRLTYLNPAWHELSGHPPDRCIGKDLLEFVVAEDRATICAALAQLMSCERHAVQLRARLDHTNGSRRWIELDLQRTRTEDERDGCASGLITDVTERVVAESRLKASEERLRMTLENTPNVAVQWIDSADGRIVHWNSAAERLYGWCAADAIGKAPGELFAGAGPDPGLIARVIDDAREGVRCAPVERELPTRDGRRIWVMSTLFPITGNDGDAPIVVRMDVDISERKAGEARLASYQRELEALVEARTADLVRTEARASVILNSSADGLFGLDGNGRIVFVNDAACTMLGFERQELLGEDAHARLHHSRGDGSAHPREQCPIVAALAGGEVARVDGEVFWRADGRPMPIMYAVHPLRSDHDAEGVVVSFVDMSAQRAISQAKERALLEAETLARMRSEFLANMSHEIRTPLHGVLGFAGIGLRRIDNKKKVREAFVKIRRAGEHLLGVINDILDFASLDAGKLKIASIPTSPADEVDGAIEVLAGHAADKGIYLRCRKGRALPRSCLSDPLRIKQVLINLISNAVKFTPHGGVRVEADAEGGELVFRVADSGIGIAADRLQSIFSPFEQVDGSSTRTAGGTGLGLTITRRLVDRMGGTLEVRSEPGQGSTFEVRLPLVTDPDDQPPGEPGLSRRPPDDRPLAGLHLLVAEDNEVNRVILADDLEYLGATVSLVGDGLAAVDAVRVHGAQYYDAVLMDLQMPVMDGFAATRALREMSPGLPVIAQTAHAFGQEQARCREAGMVAYVSKPIDSAQLAQTISECVARV